MVWAEMADTFAESSEEFAYLICQDRRTGRVLTVQDNRSRLDEMAASGKLVINESLSSRATKMITGLIGGAPPEPAK